MVSRSRSRLRGRMSAPMTSAATASALIQPVIQITIDATMTASDPSASLPTSRNAARRLKLSPRRALRTMSAAMLPTSPMMPNTMSWRGARGAGDNQAMDALDENEQPNREQDRCLGGRGEHLGAAVAPGAAGRRWTAHERRGQHGDREPAGIREQVTGIDDECEAAGENRADDLGDEDRNADPECDRESSTTCAAVPVIVCHAIRVRACPEMAGVPPVRVYPPRRRARGNILL